MEHFMLTVLSWIIFSLSQIKTDVVDLGCDPGWYNNGRFCYLFNNNKLVNQKQANAECGNMKSYLLRVESSDELAFVKQILSDFSSEGFWTDMSDLRFDGTDTGTGNWMWGQYEAIDNTTIKWNKYPVSNRHKACGAINIQGRFVNDMCGRKMGYICEIAQAPNKGCPQYWLAGNDACFFFSDTSDPTQMLTWQQARDACAAKVPKGFKSTSKLLTVDDPNDSYYITNNLPEVAQTTTTFWTGLILKGDNWGWFNGDRYNPSYFKWAVEPDAIDNKEHCATILQSGLFSDQDCSKHFNYICRKFDQKENTDYYFGCDGWTRAGHKCYMFYDAPKTTWPDANRRCQSIGGSMLKIENLDEKNWLEWEMTFSTEFRAYWTGMNDQNQKNVFRWADGAVANQSLIKWNQEPNSWAGNEDCSTVSNSGIYNDIGCTTEAPFICEVKGNGITCPAGWVARTPGNCYYFSRINETYSWFEANDLCHKSHAVKSGVPTTLLSVNDINERTWINNQLSQLPYSNVGYWTSLNDRNSEGVWMFYDDINNQNLNLSIITWGGEPYEEPGYDCTYVTFGGRYYTTKCGHTIGFVCEKFAAGQNAANSWKSKISIQMVFMCILVSLYLK